MRCWRRACLPTPVLPPVESPVESLVESPVDSPVDSPVAAPFTVVPVEPDLMVPWTGLVAIRREPCMWTSSSWWAFTMAQVAERALGLEPVRPRLIRVTSSDPG